MAFRRTPPLLAIAVLLAAGIASGSDLRKRQSSTGAVEQTCGFQGNTDMYGLGIRIGIYLQASAIVISTLFKQISVIDQLSLANGLFQFALTVGLIYVTATSPEFEAVEAAMVVLLGIVSSFQAPPAESHPGIQAPYTPAKIQKFVRHWAFPTLRTIVELILLCYSAWFWFRGLDKLTHSPCTGFAFFFARVDLYGWFRTLGKIYIVAELLSQAIVYGTWIMKLREKAQQPDPPLPPSQNLASTTQHPVTEPPDDGVWAFFINHWGSVLAINRLLVLVFVILSVELMVRWNKVSAVRSLSTVGQLIAFLIGFGSIISVAVEWDWDQKEVGDEERNALEDAEKSGERVRPPRAKRPPRARGGRPP